MDPKQECKESTEQVKETIKEKELRKVVGGINVHFTEQEEVSKDTENNI